MLGWRIFVEDGGCRSMYIGYITTHYLGWLPGSRDIVVSLLYTRRSSFHTTTIGGYIYRGWFVLYTLAKYDIILGKSWMEEVPHHVDLNRNILWLEQNLLDCKFKYRLAGLPQGIGRQECQALAFSIVNFAKTTTTSRQLPEIAEFMVAEITDEVTYQQDCAHKWQQVFDKDVPIGSELQATELNKVLEFENKIRAQYAELFQEQTRLPSIR